jgi:hypothetical protein
MRLGISIFVPVGPPWRPAANPKQVAGYGLMQWYEQQAEMHAHRRFTITTNVQVYFCDPAAPGSAAQTRTPTACCGSTSREEL